MFNNVNLAIIKYAKPALHHQHLVLLVILINWLIRGNAMMLLNVPKVLLLMLKMEYVNHVILIVPHAQDLIIINVLLVLLIGIP